MKKLIKPQLTEIEIMINKQMKEFTEMINKALLEDCVKGHCEVKNCKVYLK